MSRAPVVFLLAFALVPRAGSTQDHRHRHRTPDIPIGPEFRVNTYTTADQRGSFVAGTLGYPLHRVVVWTSIEQDGSGLGVFGQVDQGGEFRVNTYTTGYQAAPSVAIAENGNFVVVWASDQDGSESGVFGQRFTAAGAPLGPEFRVNTYTTDNQQQPRVATDANGNFVVVWTSEDQDGSGAGVFGQRFFSSGAPVGPEFRANTYTTGFQYRPAVSAAANLDNFVVVWQDGTTPGGGAPGRGVFGQRFVTVGVPLGPEFQVETYTTGFQGAPAIVVQPAGSYVVVWHSDGQDGSDLGIFGQRYGSNGSTFGPEFRVNTDTTGAQAYPTIATDALGCFFVAWTGVDASGSDVFGQSYIFGDPTEERQYRINTFTTGTQARATAGSLPSGTFVIAWESQDQDGSGYGIFGQIDNHFIPVELMTFGVE
jgi:hypothetical protein